MFGIFEKLRNRITDWCLSPREVAIGDLYIDGQDVEVYNEETGELKFIGRSDHDNLFVRSPSGWAKIDHCMKTVPFDVWELKTEKYSLLCADEHIVMMADGSERHVRDLQKCDVVDTITGPDVVVSVTKLDRPAEEMYDLSLADEHVYYTNGILSHNSVMACVYILWYSIFNFEKTVLIASNKNSNAQEMIFRIKFIYERLPMWLKPGLEADGYNKHSLGFDNGTRILSQATTPETGRGLSISLLFCLGGDNDVTVRDKETGEIKTITLEQLYSEMLTFDPECV